MNYSPKPPLGTPPLDKSPLSVTWPQSPLSSKKKTMKLEKKIIKARKDIECCLNCAPYCQAWVSSLNFHKFSGEWLVELHPQISSPLYLGSDFALNSQALRAIGSGFVLNFPLRNFDLVAPLKFAYDPNFQSGWWGQRTMRGLSGYGPHNYI